MPSQTLLDRKSDTDTQAQSVDLAPASESFENGEYSLAISQYAMLRGLPEIDQHRVLDGLGRSHYRLGEYVEACDFFEQILLLHPQDAAEAHLWLGNCHLALRNVKESEQHFRLALGSDSDGSARYGIACIRCHQGEHQNALGWLERAIKSRPSLRSHARSDTDVESLWPYIRFKELTETDESRDWVVIFAFAIAMPFAATLVIVKWILPQFVRDALYRVYLRFTVATFGEPMDLHGLQVASLLLRDRDECSTYYAQINSALNLIRRCRPRTYIRLRNDLKLIAVARLPRGGEFRGSIRACLLDTNLFAGEDEDEHARRDAAQTIASVIVHEACHARCFAVGLRYRKVNVHREEQLCRREEIRFHNAAKTDIENPLAQEHDAEFHERYGMFERWYYDRHYASSASRRWRDIWNRFRSGNNYGIHEEFFSHVLSGERTYRDYVSDLDSAISDSSRDAHAWFQRGYAWHQIRRYEDAVRDLNKATRLAPDNFGMWTQLGSSAYYAGDHELAFQAFKTAHAIADYDERCLHWLIHLSMILPKRRSHSIEFAEKRLAIRKTDHLAFADKAAAFFVNGRLAEAQRFIEQALEFHPECRRSLRIATSIYDQLKQSDEADVYWQRYLNTVSAACKEFRRPRKTQAIVLTVNLRMRIHLRILVSTSPMPEAELRSLAQDLLASTDQSAAEASKAHDCGYLHAVVKQDSPNERSILVPKAIARRSGIRIADVKVPTRSFAAMGSPSPLSAITVCVDRKSPFDIEPFVEMG